MTTPPLRGVYAAVVTPLQADGQLDLETLPRLLTFLRRRGCHGALLLGTTGEGPSFAVNERRALLQAATAARQAIPDFRLLAGVGTPSLEETIHLTRMAFDLGLDGVVALPPYYYRKVTDEGLFLWFQTLIRRAVPADGALLGYHIPAVSGVPLSLNLIARLKAEFPTQFAGLKDSSGDPEHARQLGELFGRDLRVFSGNDRLFSLALGYQASGCITAMANLYSPDLRRVWDTFQAGESAPAAQQRLEHARQVFDRYPPAPALLKALLAQGFDFPHWSARPPLVDLPDGLASQVLAELTNLAPIPDRALA